MNSRTFYLCCYNSLQLYLWTQVIVQALITFLSTTRHESQSLSLIYHSSIAYAHKAQTFAWLEPLHTLLGLAGAGVFAAVIQCLGRYVVLVKIIEPIERTHSSAITLALLYTWAFADIVRYVFYLRVALKSPPYFLLWLRYSLFLALYPIGILCEWLIYWHTLAYVDHTQLYSVKLPNSWNFAFQFGIWNRLVLVLYVFFGPFMFSHMLRQRRKKLRSS